MNRNTVRFIVSWQSCASDSLPNLAAIFGELQKCTTSGFSNEAAERFEEIAMTNCRTKLDYVDEAYRTVCKSE
jgi:hypothetical protein